MKQAYITKGIAPASLELLDHANAILAEYGVRMTVRQTYYQLVARDLIPNSVKSYRRVVRVLRDGRLTGLLDWDHIEDRLRLPHIPTTWDSIGQIVDAARDQFRKDRWAGQLFNVEVWLEKDALAGIVGDATRRWQVPLQVNRGYSSITAMREAALRLRRKQGNTSKDHVVIGYLGDHDPSGEDMVRDIRDRLATFGADVTVIKLAILGSDIERYDLPPQPVKATDSRADAFRQAHGEDCVELDALRPDELDRRVDTFIREHLDMELWDEVIEEEDRQREAVHVDLEDV